jgi:uncharacterized RDD family membrane protein YckC
MAYGNPPPNYGDVPPGGYGNMPPPPPGYGNAPSYTYANWGQRVGAALIDQVPAWVVYAVGFATHTGVIILLGGLIALGITIYNRWILAGRTGQSWGKKVLNIKLISESTGQPIGGGMAFARDIVHILDAIPCYIGYLWPLWDAKRQTFADKILSTVVVPV